MLDQSGMGNAVSKCLGLETPVDATPVDAGDPIKHIVYVMLENRSFDQMLGTLPLPGLDGADSQRHFNLNASGKLYFQTPTAPFVCQGDYPHEHPQVMQQLQVTVPPAADADSKTAAAVPTNGGFVTGVQHADGGSLKRCAEVMSYFAPGQLPVMHALAQEFTVCNRWFSSFPGSTWPNRFFALTGTSRGQTTTPSSPADVYLPDQKSILDLLSAAGKEWRVFYEDFSTAMLLTRQWKAHTLARYQHMTDFYRLARGPERDFPAFAFVEPRYSGPQASDQHPPHNVLAGDALLGDMYAALRNNADLWASTLLVIAYDEHGGFYDHVPPPRCVPPDRIKGSDGFAFDLLGVRVPVLLVSPWTERGVVDSTIYDHTSLLRYMADKWRLPFLTARVEHAATFAHRFRATPRTDTPTGAAIARLAQAARAGIDQKLVQEEEQYEDWNGKSCFGMVTFRHCATHPIHAGFQKDAYAIWQTLGQTNKMPHSAVNRDVRRWSDFCAALEQSLGVSTVTRSA